MHQTVHVPRKTSQYINPHIQGTFRSIVQHLRSTRARQASPKKDWQEDHEKCMCPEVGSKREVGIQRGRPNSLLKPSQIGRLVANEREEFLSRPVTPVRELVTVFFFFLAQKALALNHLTHTSTQTHKPSRAPNQGIQATSHTMIEVSQPSIRLAMIPLSHTAIAEGRGAIRTIQSTSVSGP